MQQCGLWRENASLKSISASKLNGDVCHRRWRGFDHDSPPPTVSVNKHARNGNTSKYPCNTGVFSSWGTLYMRMVTISTMLRKQNAFSIFHVENLRCHIIYYMQAFMYKHVCSHLLTFLCLSLSVFFSFPFLVPYHRFLCPLTLWFSLFCSEDIQLFTWFIEGNRCV